SPPPNTIQFSGYEKRKYMQEPLVVKWKHCSLLLMMYSIFIVITQYLMQGRTDNSWAPGQ
ncbi:unnamed protein product, partial [Staurois parvus]